MSCLRRKPPGRSIRYRRIYSGKKHTAQIDPEIFEIKLAELRKLLNNRTLKRAAQSELQEENAVSIHLGYVGRSAGRSISRLVTQACNLD